MIVHVIMFDQSYDVEAYCMCDQEQTAMGREDLLEQEDESKKLLVVFLFQYSM